MKKPSSLLDQEDAVGSYLADMLSEPLSVASRPVGIEDEAPVDNLVLLRQALAEVPETDDQASVDSDPIETGEAQAAPQEQESVEAIAAPVLDFPLQCLMFTVGSQQLSMPLIRMSGVVEYPDSMSRLPGSSAMALGVFQYRGNNVQVIDSAALLGIKRDGDCKPAKLIVLQGEKWAISADSLASVVAVNEEDVKWHHGRKNSMMLGTIKASLAQLLNPDSISENLGKA